MAHSMILPSALMFAYILHYVSFSYGLHDDMDASIVFTSAQYTSIKGRDTFHSFYAWFAWCHFIHSIILQNVGIYANSTILVLA